MLQELKLVQGSVSTKGFVPILSHFHIYDNRIQGGNGRLTIDVPFPYLDGLNITVPSAPFIKAVEACKEEPEIKLTEAGNLMLKSGTFRARIPVGEHIDYPRLDPPAAEYTVGATQPILPVLKRLLPFIGEDASKPWANGIKFVDGYAYATNNPVIARVPIDYPVETVIPTFMITELLRINREPQNMHLTEEGVFFDLGEEIWIKSPTISLPWPDVTALFASVPEGVMTPVPVGLAESILRVMPFCADARFQVIQFLADGITTEDGTTRAAMEGIDLVESRWHIPNMLLVLSEATDFDLSPYPSACPWLGDNIEGIMLGLRDE